MLLNLPLFAQQASWIPGDLIIQFQAGETPSLLQREMASTDRPFILRTNRVLSKRMNLYLMQFDPTAVSEKEVLQIVRHHPSVQLAQFNHLVSSRHLPLFDPWKMATTLPNDANFDQQWALDNTGQTGGTSDADIDATDAWDVVSGGLSALGDTIVVAVIDEGIDFPHEDLTLWTNHSEIPGDGLDNDGNGYIDDVNGWNAYNQSGNLPGSVHGTHVSGIAAARGDNMIGVSGVNWNSQVMFIAGSSGDEATVLEAYGYVLEQRARYNASNGAEGAFVVASNSSFGVNFGQASNFPAWCAMYDSLGAQGVMNAVATMNIGQDVDQVGDMPATCLSDWVIAITNTDHLDQRNSGAAFGLTHIDLGAPGTNILSTFPNNTYGFISGTSMATPHVTGSLALLVAGACPALMIQYRNDPAQTALLFREFILTGVDANTSLQSSVATGGRLNVNNSLTHLLDSCANLPVDCLPPFQLSAVSHNDTSAIVSWTQWQTAQSFTLRYRLLGQTQWIDSISVTATQSTISGLSGCQQYEFQVQAYCTAGNSGYFSTSSFQTLGCCEAPQGISISTMTDTTANIKWNPVFGSTDYLLEYRPVGTTNWTMISSTDTTELLPNLSACTSYEIRIATQCGSIQLDYSPIKTFTTRGCGACLDLSYCELSGTVDFEWIRAVKIGPVDTYTDADGGYGDYTGTSFQFSVDSSYDISLTPGFNGPAFDEDWRIWIDLDQNGTFDSAELLFDPPLTIGEVTGTLVFPPGTPTGSTRMRVSMKFPGFGSPEPSPPCGEYEGGEVEDYCITLTAGDTVFCTTPSQVAVDVVANSDSMLVSWDPVAGGQMYDIRLEQSGTAIVEHFSTSSTSINIGGLASCTDYLIQIQSLCTPFGSGFSSPLSFKSQGCGVCLDLPYCPSVALNANNEWIAGISIGSFDFSSGPDQGYGSYTNFSILFPRGDTLPISLRPGFATTDKEEFWQLWADWDQNGQFDAPSELIFQAKGIDGDTLRDSIVVPLGVPTGTTRLRILMNRDSTTLPCDSPDFGETEDYCINIMPPVSVQSSHALPRLRMYPNPTSEHVLIESSRLIDAIELFSSQGQLVFRHKKLSQQKIQLSVAAYPPGIYFVRLHTTAGHWMGKLIVAP